MKRRTKNRVAWIVCVVAIVTMMEIRSTAAQFFFSITLGDIQLSNATDYDLNVEGKKKFSLRVKLQYSSAGDFAAVYQGGQKFDQAVIQILDQSVTPVATYTLGDLIVETVQYSSEASTSLVKQEIVLSAKSLVVTTP